MERAIRVVEPLVDDVWLAIGNGIGADWPEVHLVADRIQDIGPLAGIHAALHDMKREWLLVLPVDLPFMTTEVLRSLIYAPHDGNPAIVAIDGSGRLQPLCALLHRSIRPTVDHAIMRKEYGPTRLFSAMDSVRYVTFPDEHLRNVNRPEDLL